MAQKQFKIIKIDMFGLNKQQKWIDVDERSNPLMTSKTLKYFCQKEGLFATPELNDKLYLQYKGFIKIIPETLSKYHSLVALWLNNNGISKIEGLHTLINLTSLALNNNFISKIEGLNDLHNLSILNLSHNKIQQIEGLQSLRRLQTINIAHNFLITSKSISGLKSCERLTTIDLSQNQLENNEEMFQQISLNRNIGCLYLKATPFSRGFRNYRKRLVCVLRKLKFLDDRPVFQQDHRLAEAWVQGGIQYQRLERQKINEEKESMGKEQRQTNSTLKITEMKEKPEGFIASIKDTSIKIMNISDKDEQQKIIKKYFSNQQDQIQKNKEKLKQQEEQMKEKQMYYQDHQTEVISEKVHEILGKTKDLNEIQEENLKMEKQIKLKWKPKYENILQTLLLRYKFDFSEVQPSFNMIMTDINKKLLRAPVRFQISELRRIWTEIERKKRLAQA